MSLTPELVIAVSALITGVLTWWGQQRANRLAARKDEMELLRGEVTRLQDRVTALEDKNIKLNDENDGLREENRLLKEEVLMLRELLRRNSIPLPPSKIFPPAEKP